MFYVSMLLQTSPDEAVMAELARLQRSFSFLNSGLWVAWLVIVIYVLMLAAREKKLAREIAGLKAMLDDREKS
jgi:CcmD family protein